MIANNGVRGAEAAAAAAAAAAAMVVVVVVVARVLAPVLTAVVPQSLRERALRRMSLRG